MKTQFRFLTAIAALTLMFNCKVIIADALPLKDPGTSNKNPAFLNVIMTISQLQEPAGKTDDVKPWESFRGWSNRVPYGSGYSNKSLPSEPKKEKPRDKPINLNRDIDNTNPKSLNAPKENPEDVQPWEGFRGWSPRVRY